MKTKWVITIGREFCSGGAETAHKVSKLLDIPYYDKRHHRRDGGIPQLATEIVVHHDERPISYTDVGGYQYGDCGTPRTVPDAAGGHAGGGGPV